MRNGRSKQTLQSLHDIIADGREVAAKAHEAVQDLAQDSTMAVG